MKRVFKLRQYFLLLIIFIVNIMCVNALEITEITTDKYKGEYNIEDLIKNYNVVTLGTKHPNVNVKNYKEGDPYGVLSDCIHIVGPILIQGNLENSNQYGQLYHSQFVNGVSSYIKGRINTNGNATNNDNTFPIFYVGIENKVEQPYDNYNYHINDYQWYSNSETKKTNDYIDFDKLYDSIKEEQNRLKRGSILTPDADGKIYIQAGGNYTIESFSNVNKIVFEGLTKDADQTTMITVTDQGDDTKKIKFPLLLHKDGDEETEFITHDVEGEEEFYGSNIVWNVTDAEYLTFTQAGFVGHVIAPQADAQLDEMNWAGCFIVNSFHGAGNTEGHIFRYYGIELSKDPEIPIPVVTKVTISKLDENNKLLPGAELEIIDKDGNVVTKWTTTTETKDLLGILKVGETYTLHEVKAPVGYELADDMQLTIQNTDEVQSFAMIDKKKQVKVTVEKHDSNGNYVVGAQMQLLDIDGNIIDEWITSDKVYTILADLIIGDDYIIHEVKAPIGYKLAEDIRFTVNDTNEIQNYIVIDIEDPIPEYPIVSISKLDNSQIPLEGAELEILDKDGNRIVVWTSTSEAYILRGILKVGETYTLHEISAPEGYKLADDIQFTVEDTKDIQEIKIINERKDTIVSPDTGDTAVIKYVIIGILSIVGIVLLLMFLKKRKSK